MFAIVGLNALDIEYGIPSSTVWLLGLLLLLLCPPITFYLSARYPTWGDLKVALESTFPVRAIIAATHIHHHTRPLDHMR
jgi:hypothetical protein